MIAVVADVDVFDVAGRREKRLYAGLMFDDVVTRSWDGTDRRGVPVSSRAHFIGAARPSVGVSKVVLVRR